LEFFQQQFAREIPMNADRENSRSIWLDVPFPKAGRLTSNLRTDVLVIGAGIAGLSTAYELAVAGRDVVVVDRGVIGGGMTARTSAHLSWEIDDTYAELIDTVGEAEAKQYFDSQCAAVDRAEGICVQEKLDCDFARLDLFVFAPDSKGRKELEKEIEAARKLGFEGIGWADAPVAKETKGCLRFPGQARFHPLKYLDGLVRAIKRKGGKVFANTTIMSVDETKTGPVAKTEGGVTIRAKAIVAATNSPFVNRLAVHTKQAPYRTYMIGLELPQQSDFDALVWDTLDPYHYVRACRTGEGKFLILGGEDHKTGKQDDGEARLDKLEAWAREHFPDAGKRRYQWSGQIYEPVDYAPFIGRSPGAKNVYLVTGDSGEGLTTGVAASLVLRDLIVSGKSRWAKVYRPNRKTPKPSAVGTFVKDAAGAAKHLVEHIAPAQAKPDEIGRNKGAVITQDGKKVAAYRDEKGRLHRRSAACTHVGCVISWNSFERCWDCPCHGSHFDARGEAIQCPAVAPLGKP
jgi:glycine/D-amino acid oxidase-like deaminating enzyme/nitrite reductase/ring-hydroxylating ferredoxin subunit